MKWIWAKDKWTSTCSMSDKLAHFDAGFMGTITLLLLWPQMWWLWVLIALLAAILWEVKDALFNPWNLPEWLLTWFQDEDSPYSDPHCHRSSVSKAELVEHFERPLDFKWWMWLLGDGFSCRDMICTWAGILVAWGLKTIGG